MGRPIAAITLQQIKSSAVAAINQHLFEKDLNGKKDNDKSIKIPKAKKRSKEKEWIQYTISSFAQTHGIKLVDEYKFFEFRKWKADWAFPDLKILFEYEGLISEKSRHTTISGFSNDTEKYNKASELGFKVYRYTALTYKRLEADLMSIINQNKT